MKGIIFNLLEDAVTRQYGADTWDELLAETNLDGVYTTLGSYPDEEIQALIQAGSRLLGISPFEVLRWFGRQAIPLLLKRYPGFFQAETSTRSFLLSVNSIIHPEVLKIYPNAYVPTFEFHDAPDGGLLLGYHSERRMCALIQGFAEGAAEYYGEAVAFEHRLCMHRGDERCLCHITFASDRTPLSC